jgi:hypothetical protein
MKNKKAERSKSYFFITDDPPKSVQDPGKRKTMTKINFKLPPASNKYFFIDFTQGKTKHIQNVSFVPCKKYSIAIAIKTHSKYKNMGNA